MTIQTSIDIDAPPSTVWAILTDFDAAPSWNPFIRQIAGEARPGCRLSITIAPPGKAPMTFKPTVLVADPERELRWLGRVLLPGILDGEHWFKLTELDGGRTRFDHGEVFSGLLARILGDGLRVPTRQGFEAMNNALKARAEQMA